MTDEPGVGLARRPVGPPPLPLRVIVGLAVPLLLYGLVATGQKALDNYRLNQEAEGLRAEIASLRSENIQLQQQIEQARTPNAIESIAREQLGLIKPGDHPLVLVDSGAAAPPAPTPVATPPPRPVWRQWYEYFFG